MFFFLTVKKLPGHPRFVGQLLPDALYNKHFIIMDILKSNKHLRHQAPVYSIPRSYKYLMIFVRNYIARYQQNTQNISRGLGFLDLKTYLKEGKL